MAEPGQHTRDGQTVVAQVECHRQDQIAIRTHAATARESADPGSGQILPIVNLAAIGQSAVHLGQGTRGRDAIGRGNLAVQQRSVTLDHGSHTREVHRAERRRCLQRGDPRCHRVEQRVEGLGLGPDDARNPRGSVRRRPAEVNAIGIERFGHLSADQFPHSFVCHRSGQA